MINRRLFLGALGAGVSLGATRGVAMPGRAALARRLSAIEAERGGRLGVAIFDTGSGLRADLRGDERFPLCSTFKLLAVAAVLARAETGREDMRRRVVFTRDDVVEYSPVTKERIGGKGMTLSELCDAAMTLSDNTAGNLLLAAIGGPDGLTQYARTLGDKESRLDRIEPFLNEAVPGDPRDTTTPLGMLAGIETLLMKDALAKPSRETLTAWLLATRTNAGRLVAGMPTGCRVGSRTGTGERGTTNEVGAIWAPGGRAPILFAIYLTGAPGPGAQRNATLAEIGRAVAAHLNLVD
ncbi:MAG: class A beta-lactamase [Rhizobiales bacterium]|nr:class A beta-lactamase [Hyphomicrobiales bacterium]